MIASVYHTLLFVHGSNTEECVSITNYTPVLQETLDPEKSITGVPCNTCRQSCIHPITCCCYCDVICLFGHCSCSQRNHLKLRWTLTKVWKVRADNSVTFRAEDCVDILCLMFICMYMYISFICNIYIIIIKNLLQLFLSVSLPFIHQVHAYYCSNILFNPFQVLQLGSQSLRRWSILAPWSPSPIPGRAWLLDSPSSESGPLPLRQLSSICRPGTQTVSRVVISEWSQCLTHCYSLMPYFDHVQSLINMCF